VKTEKLDFEMKYVGWNYGASRIPRDEVKGNIEITELKINGVDVMPCLIENGLIVVSKDELQCLMSMPNLGTYIGKWIAVVGDEVVATGSKGSEVYKASKEKYPDKMPLVMKVPEDKIMLL
jgi:hypothetical protein